MSLLSHVCRTLVVILSISSIKPFSRYSLPKYNKYRQSCSKINKLQLKINSYFETSCIPHGNDSYSNIIASNNTYVDEYSHNNVFLNGFDIWPTIINKDVKIKSKYSLISSGSILLSILTNAQVNRAVTPSISLVKSRSNIKYSGAIGYEAAESLFSPGESLKTIPLLPQSALLNTLPFKDELIGQLQAYFESFVQLISPSNPQQLQIANNDSVLWTNLRVNAQRAAGIFIYNRKDLLPKVNISEVQIDLYIKTYQVAENRLSKLQLNALKLVNSSSRSSVSECLRGMQKCLSGLCDIAYLLNNPITDKSWYSSISYETDLDSSNANSRVSLMSFDVI